MSQPNDWKFFVAPSLYRNMSRDESRDPAYDDARVAAILDGHRRYADYLARRAHDGTDFSDAVRFRATSRTGARVGDSKATPARLATHVLHAALHVLPPATRPPYREELDRQLAELAAAGRPRRAQLAHVLRAARRMWSFGTSPPTDGTTR